MAKIGYGFFHRDAKHGLEVIQRAEAAGVPTVWLVMPSLGRDSLSIITAAATMTSTINLGTAIVPAFTRHPCAMATQVMAIEDLAPGRLRLGIGTSHQHAMIAPYGQKFDRPLTQLREYLSILKPLLTTGKVDFQGEYYSATAEIAFAPGTPVLISALRENAWELAGEMSDGGISWNCPPHFLEGVARPAMARGAAKGGRTAPPMIAHAMVSLAGSRDEVRAEGRKALGNYAGAPFYRRMFEAAGFEIGEGNTVPDALVDAFVVWGSDDDIAAELERRIAAGMDEMLVNLVGETTTEAQDRLFRVIGTVADRLGR